MLHLLLQAPSVPRPDIGLTLGVLSSAHRRPAALSPATTSRRGSPVEAQPVLDVHKLAVFTMLKFRPWRTLGTHVSDKPWHSGLAAIQMRPSNTTHSAHGPHRALLPFSRLRRLSICSHCDMLHSYGRQQRSMRPGPATKGLDCADTQNRFRKVYAVRTALASRFVSG